MSAFTDNSDPNVTPQEFETCAAGQHKVVGIEEYLSTDDNDKPIYKDNEWKGLAVLLKLKRADGGEGPAMSATPSELALLVRAFGGDPAALPKDRMSTEYLYAVKSAINQANKEVVATVNEKGYVSFVMGMIPPEGFFTWKYTGWRNLDGTRDEPEWQESRFGNATQIILEFEVVGNMYGKPTLYDGYSESVYLQSPFSGEVLDGKPSVKVTKNGGRPVWVTRWYKIFEVFCPEIGEKTVWSAGELDNPIAVCLDYLEKGNKIGLAYFRKGTSAKAKRPKLQIDTLTAMEKSESQKEETPEQRGMVFSEDIEQEHPNLVEWIHWVYAQKDNLFKTTQINALDDLALTPDGVKWATENMLQYMQQAQLEPQAKAISQFTEDECEKLVNVVKAGWG